MSSRKCKLSMSSDEDNDEVGSVSKEDLSNEESQSCTEIASDPSTGLVLFIVSINISFHFLSFHLCAVSIILFGFLVPWWLKGKQNIKSSNTDSKKKVE